MVVAKLSPLLANLVAVSEIDATAHNPDDLVSGVHLLFIIKNFERIGDYATGIAEQVYFLSEGEFIEDFRPKADKTSWNA